MPFGCIPVEHIKLGADAEHVYAFQMVRSLKVKLEGKRLKTHQHTDVALGKMNNEILWHCVVNNAAFNK